MTNPEIGVARARASCSRCHKRKKRCDRVLPSCKNCHSASVRCSFEDDDGQNASFPIAYVRGIEEKIRQMEDIMRNHSLQLLPASNDVCSNLDPGGPFYENSHMEDTVVLQTDAGSTFQGGSTDVNNESHADMNVEQEQSSEEPQTWKVPAAVEHTPSFAQELKTLSLEATADRHLGSTSGLSFAKLTQKVLRRLTPDKADFVFAPNQENTTGASFFNFTSPSELFNDSMYESLSGSISVHPLLFGDLFLADLTEAGVDVNNLAWPSDEAHVQHLVNFYFAHSHTLYPILDKREVMETLDKIRGKPQSLEAQSPLQNFRLWMVLATGSTAYSSLSLTEESESMVYYNKALQYADQALEIDEMSALEVVMLQVSYSFFNQLGPNTWFLVGTAARLALGLGLHTSSTYVNLSANVQQRRKRIFFSIYMMDRFDTPFVHFSPYTSFGCLTNQEVHTCRVVSIALGRPFAIHDDDVDVLPFTDKDEDDTEPDGTLGQISLQPTLLSVPLHILRLRQIASEISRQVYSSKKNSNLDEEERKQILTKLHQDLLGWRRSMPFPLPETDENVPHLNTLWYDFNYYTHLAMIYRPSPLAPSSDPEKIKTLETAASMSLRQAYAMHQQHRFAYNWLNFLSIFTSTLSLVYAVTAQPDDLSIALKQRRTLFNLDLAIQLFDSFGLKFAAARKIRRMIAEISHRYKEILSSTANR